MNEVINIVRAEYVKDYVLSLVFDDGTEQLVDFEPFLRSAQNPAIQSYMEPALFQAFRIEHGELLWGDYDLCFPMVDLYENNLLHLPASAQK
ncbi:DUF2442 domain-containing protein [Leptonema illini]|uniref:DUF2442 domain-containing protein n=1 Tax=Leptonema illini DSM 21528 TaxID=929563 RepID=H2C9Z9_9LEPT|nr:DUF2442 domain-containing protein [Leptonema illini]EHQ05123.1 Protein of unknown function DUF2442 [Leptonema illini DSM 21528]